MSIKQRSTRSDDGHQYRLITNRRRRYYPSKSNPNSVASVSDRAPVEQTSPHVFLAKCPHCGLHGALISLDDGEVQWDCFACGEMGFETDWPLEYVRKICGVADNSSEI